MRTAFINTLFSSAKKDKKIILLTGDVGFSVFEPFKNSLPDQFLNMGVAEQNMTGVAAGLAIEGKIPIIYSILPFVTMRNFEQIRNDICYQNLNVKIVAVGSGFSYGVYGHTHYGLEDIGILRTLGNLTILSPADPLEAAESTKWALDHKGPVYIRLGKAGEPILHDSFRFKIGKGSVLRGGIDIAIFSTGSITKCALDAAEILEKKGSSTKVISMPSLKPIDYDLILKTASQIKAVFTVEEHSIIGGLGSAVAEVLAENRSNVIFKRLGVPSEFTKKTGTQEFMRQTFKLNGVDIANTIYHYIISKE